MFEMSLKFVSKFLAIALLMAALPLVAQDGRKIKHQVQPVYPELAKQANVSGSVRLQVTVAPSGKVVETKVLGGSPLLIASAEQAVRQWVYEPAPETSTTTVQINFNQ
jgi:protein TonB